MATSTHVTTSIESGVLIARLTTSALSEYEAGVIGTQIKDEAPGATWKVVIDMTEVVHIASAGLGMLVDIRNTAKKYDGEMAACGISPQIMEVMKMTHLHKIFVITKDVKGAVKKVK